MAKDLFSKQASVYAQYRPVYPPELFGYILSFVKEKKAAWDCATGNGQAAVELSRFFEKVFATDISEKQLQHAKPVGNIIYTIAAAEETSFPGNSFNLITVAQAYHWFNFEAFGKEVNRIACPGAIVAVWGYSLVQCEDENINAVTNIFYRETVGPYWDKERKYVDDHYKTVPFPFAELPSKEFTIQVGWKKEDFLGYLNTWSSVQHFQKDRHYNPVDEFAGELLRVWHGDGARQFHFPLFLRIGRVKAEV